MRNVNALVRFQPGPASTLIHSARQSRCTLTLPRWCMTLPIFEEHIAFQWLCGCVGMNAKTLADFRVDHGAVLERLLVDSFTALVRAGVASLDRVAQDGVRVRASAGASSFRRHSTLAECRREAESRLRDLRAQVNADPAGASRKQAAARLRVAEDRERRVREPLAVTEELHARQQEQATEGRLERRAQEGEERTVDARRVDPLGADVPGERVIAADHLGSPEVRIGVVMGEHPPVRLIGEDVGGKQWWPDRHS